MIEQGIVCVEKNMDAVLTYAIPYSWRFKFNSIQNSLFSTQHIVHTTMFFYTYDVSKRERAEDGAYVGSFPNIII